MAAGSVLDVVRSASLRRGHLTRDHICEVCGKTFGQWRHISLHMVSGCPLVEVLAVGQALEARCLEKKPLWAGSWLGKESRLRFPVPA